MIHGGFARALKERSELPDSVLLGYSQSAAGAGHSRRHAVIEGKEESYMARRMEEPPEVMGLPAGSIEDKELTLAYQRGEDGAYQAIYDRYSNRVHSVCRRMLGNSQDAQDAAQESFLRVYQALGRFNGRYQLGPWITRIATNVCLDHIRAKSRRPKDVLLLEIAELDTPEELEVEGPDDIVIRRSESRRVRKVLQCLPPMHRAAIVLRDFEGLSYQEVAVALDISEAQVKALIHRARQGFKRSWASVALSAILPGQLLERIRKLHAPKPDATQSSSIHQVAETVAASAAPAASTCSTAFSHCGQFVAERFAPAVTAVALAATGFAGSGMSQEAHGAANPPVSQVAPAKDARLDIALVRRERSVTPTAALASETPNPTQTDAASEDRPTPEPAATPATAPKESAAPAALTASPSPTPTPEPTASPSPAEQEPANDAPPPAPPIIGVSLSSSTGSSRVADSMSTSFRCTYFSLSQTLATSVSRDSSSWPMRLSLAGSESGMALEVGVMVSGREVLFGTEGRLTALTREGDQASVQFAGTYGTGNKEAEETLGVPMAGSFRLDLTLDCASRAVIAESLTFEA